MFYLDPLYIVVLLLTIPLAIYAQIKVKSAFKKYSRMGNTTGMTGAMAARRILDASGLHDVTVEPAHGWLSDHYDPRAKALRLSPDVYNTPSVAAVGIAAHEAGHALQHAHGYSMLKLRNVIAPTAQIGSWLAFPMIFIGAILAIQGLALAGLLLFTAIVAFQVITLPVELNASNRARELVFNMGIIQTGEEAEGVSKVLSAAAMTYLAATITAIIQLLYFAWRLGLLGGNDD